MIVSLKSEAASLRLLPEACKAGSSTHFDCHGLIRTVDELDAVTAEAQRHGGCADAGSRLMKEEKWGIKQ
jgi:hypothetical protein